MATLTGIKPSPFIIQTPLPEFPEQDLTKLEAELQKSIAVAQARFDQGDYEGARASCQQIYDIAQATGDKKLLAVASTNLASALWALDRRTESREFLRQSVEANPELGENWAALAKVSLVLEDYPQAEQAVDKALDLMPEKTELWLVKGILLYKQKSPQQALAALEKALNLNPDDARAWICHASLLAEQSEGDRAMASSERAFALRKQLPEELQKQLYHWYAGALLAWGTDVMAKGDLDRSQELMAHFRRLQIQGRIERKARVVRKAIRDFRTSNPQHRKSLKALMAMLKNPWVGWQAVSYIVSEYWPEGLSAVEVVRQARE